MSGFVPRVAVFAMIFVAYPSSGLESTTTSGTHEEPSSKMMMMLQVRRLFPSVAALPPYMMHLYKQLKEDKLVAQGTANTVRSFFPFLGKAGGQDILVFNLTPVHDSEYIERVDLHLQYKRQTLWKKKALRLSILKLDHDIRAEMVITVRRSAYGSWHTVDVTDGIISSLDISEPTSDNNNNNQQGMRQNHQQQMLVGLLVEEEDDNGKDKKTIVNALSNSFLVMFSEDDENLAIDRVRRTTTTAANHSKSYFGYRDKRDHHQHHHHLLDLDDELTSSSIQQGEVRRRKFTRRPTPDAISTNGGGGGAASSIAEDKQFTKAAGRKGRKMRRLQLKWRKSWWDAPNASEGDGDDSDEDNAMEIEEITNSSSESNFCHRESLIVDFARLGWNNWIIAPRRYDAHTCTGDCYFRANKDQQPGTNYASLKDILSKQQQKNNNNNRKGGGSSLCCVPDAMSYVPLLFYDENRNVVLKKFPEMKVDSCTCR